MASKDNFTNHDTCQIQDPVNATATTTSEACVLDGYNSATVIWSLGESGSTLSATRAWVLTIEESDTATSGYVAVGVTEVIDGNVTAVASITVDDPAEDGLSYEIGYVGNARHIRAVATLTGTMSDGMLMSIIVRLGHERVGPGQQASIAATASS